MTEFIPTPKTAKQKNKGGRPKMDASEKREHFVKVIKNREVILCPDLGASDNWRSKIPVLSGICSKVVFSQLLEEHATEEQRNLGLDIADFLLMCDTPVSILQDMIQRNPNLQLLIDTFDLELVSCTSE